MRRFITIVAGAALVAGCTSTGATSGGNGTSSSPGQGGGGAAGSGAAGKGATTPNGARKQLSDEDFTVKQVEEVKAPVYLDDIDRGAQDAFGEGVQLVAAQRPDYATALKKFEEATDKDKSFLEAYFNWAMVLERTGRGDEALRIYQKALDANPGEPSAQAYISKIYLAKAREAKYLGKQQEADQWLAKSKALLDELVAKNPSNVAVNNAMALFFLSKEDFDTAERYVKEVLYVQPSNVTGLNTRGLINLKRGNLRVARWIFENKVLREDPTSTEALTNLGYTYIKLEQRPLAMRYFKQALEADPENMAVRMNIAAMLLEHLDYSGAFDHYTKVLSAQPNNDEAMIGRCDAMFGLGGAASDKHAQYEAAISCYLDYLKTNPARGDLYRRIAETYQNKLQSFDKAVEYYEAYGKHATLSAEEADKNAKIVKTLKDIIASGGLKAEPSFDEPTDGGGDGFSDDGFEDMDGGGAEGGGAE